MILEDQVALSLFPYIDRLAQNLSRAQNLVEIYNQLYGKGKGRRSIHKADVLRAAVVFTHASLEDFLRTLSLNYLPKGDEATLNAIPLKGLNSAGRAEKFLLGNLVTHRGKSIDQVIEESVSQFLERSNYNNTQEIASLLKNIGVDVSQVSSFFPKLDKMISRRHQIVHRADRVEVQGKGKQYAQSIRPADVKQWINATELFMYSVLGEIYLTETGQSTPTD
jgi:hypothetical protein